MDPLEHKRQIHAYLLRVFRQRVLKEISPNTWTYGLEASEDDAQQTFKAASMSFTETVDFTVLEKFGFSGSILTAAMVASALKNPDVMSYKCISSALDDLGAKQTTSGRSQSDHTEVHRLINLYIVNLSAAIMKRVRGPHCTFIDPALSGNTQAVIEEAKSLVNLYEERGYIPASASSSQFLQQKKE